jgi:hypothetical protein
MGKKSILIYSVWIFGIYSCECPKKYESVNLLTNSEKEWFSECTNQDTSIVVNSQNGLSDFLIFSKKPLTKYENEINNGSGKCKVYEMNERYSVNYFSSLASTNWTFVLTTQNGSHDFMVHFNKVAGQYTSCYFTLSLENINSVKNFSYYPFEIEQTKGFQLIGDTTINAKNYNDIYEMVIQLPEDVKPLEISKIYLSKKKGLIAYQTFNKINWYLN